MNVSPAEVSAMNSRFRMEIEDDSGLSRAVSDHSRARRDRQC